MITRDQHSFPEDRWYDIDNQIWYLPIVEAKIRAGFTSWAVSFMGEVLVSRRNGSVAISRKVGLSQ